MEKLNIKIKGMHCEGCEKRIENALGDIKGVKNVEADYKSGTAVVETIDTTLFGNDQQMGLIDIVGKGTVIVENIENM